MSVTENGEALLQTELEPVATGHTIARVIVKILVGHDRLDAQIAGIGGDIRGGQNTGGVENIEALVLHRPHVEIINGNDVKQIKIVLQAVNLLIPAHGTLEGIHGMAAVVLVLGLDIDVQCHCPP